MSLSKKISFLRPALSASDFEKHVVLRDDSDGSGPYIERWDHPSISWPTKAELEAVTDEQATNHFLALTAKKQRAAAYASEADPLFFKYQAGEVTKEEWLAKREEIRNRYPYPS